VMAIETRRAKKILSSAPAHEQRHSATLSRVTTDMLLQPKRSPDLTAERVLIHADVTSVRTAEFWLRLDIAPFTSQAVLFDAASVAFLYFTTLEMPVRGGSLC
jgi:hypothetical protein